MSLKDQIRQKVMDLAFKAEKVLHHYRTRSEEKYAKHSGNDEKTEKSEPGQVRTYYNNSKEERKLH
ncbi:MAG: hypothetical protein WDA09_11490 [Bacteriovoracaceae bacterium]